MAIFLTVFMEIKNFVHVFCLHTEYTRYVNRVVCVMCLYLDMTFQAIRIFKSPFHVREYFCFFQHPLSFSRAQDCLSIAVFHACIFEIEFI